MKRIFCLILVSLLLSVAIAEDYDLIPVVSNKPDEIYSSLPFVIDESLLECDGESIEILDATLYNNSEDVNLTVSKKTTKKVYLGTTYQLTVPGKKIKSCSSSNKKVASVSKAGRITPKKVGTAKITVTLTSKKQFVVTLNVIDPTVPTKVTINEGKKGTIYIGTTFQLTAVVEPATASQTVKWKSSNKSIATVNGSGLVTPKKVGSAKITATAGKKTATFIATVKTGSTVIELSKYWEKDLEDTVKELQGFMLIDSSRGYVTYSDGNVRITEYQEGSYKSGIGSIFVENTSSYSIFGVVVGMTRDMAQSLLKEYKGKGDYSEYSDWITYSPYPDEDTWLTLKFSGDKVLTISLNCFTDF